MVLEMTGLNKLVPWNVPVIAASLDVCDPFFPQVEGSLLEGLLMDFQLFGFINQTFREGDSDSILLLARAYKPEENQIVYWGWKMC